MRKTLVLVLVLVAAGLVPLACQPKPDIGLATIAVPRDTLMRDTVVTPQVVLKNFAKRSADASVRLTITTSSGTAVYDTTETGIALAANDSVVHSFLKQWQAAPAGVLTVTAYTILDKDAEQSNDTARATCWVVADTVADKEAVKTLVKQDTVHFSGSTSHDSTGGFFMDGDTAVFWWRSAQTHDSAAGVSIGLSGDSAWVDFSQHNYGYFYVLALPPGETLQLWNKPLSENTHLRAIFLRTGESTDSTRGWKLDKISLFTGQSDSTHTVKIDSMTIASSLRNIVIRDPLNTFYNIDTMVTFTPGELLTIKLYTDATSGKAFLHTFMALWPFYVRVPFTDMGSGVFQGVWHAPIVPSIRFAIFDLMERSTIFGPGMPYDYNGWLLPYKIHTAD